MKMLSKILKYDFKNGITKYWPRYVMASIAVIGILVYSISVYNFWDMQSGSEVSYSLGDLFIYINKGIEKIIINQNDKFKYPVAYIAKGIILGLLVGEYYHHECKNMGMKILISTQSRTLWITGKILRVLAIPVIYNIMVVFACTLMSGFRMSVNCDFLTWAGMNIAGMSAGILIVMCVLPFLTDIFFCTFQNFLGLFVNSHIAFTVVIAVRFISIFYVTILLPGNWEMLQRNSQIMEGGINVYAALVIAIFAIAGMIGANIILFRKKDIL